MSHFYRGEMGRIMVWRQRLDVTTNWAITSSTAIITIAFSTREVPHIIFFFNLAIVWVLLWIEARRYRFYDAFRARVRMLEAHFLVPMVMENREMLQALLQDQQIGSGWAAIKTQLRFHFHSHFTGVGDEDFPARRACHGQCRQFLSCIARWPHSVLAGRVHLCGHLHRRHLHHDLRQQEILRRNFRVRHPSFALADLADV